MTKHLHQFAASPAVSLGIMPPKKSDPRARAARRNGKLGGRPAGEPTRQVRIYAADAGKLAAHGKTTAKAIRSLLSKYPV
jgi:hypothetical protein